MDISKMKKRIDNQKFYKKHAEKLRRINKEIQSSKYKEDEEFRRMKSDKANQRHYVNNAILFVKKLYIQ